VIKLINIFFINYFTSLLIQIDERPIKLVLNLKDEGADETEKLLGKRNKQLEGSDKSTNSQ